MKIAQANSSSAAQHSGAQSKTTEVPTAANSPVDTIYMNYSTSDPMISPGQIIAAAAGAGLGAFAGSNGGFLGGTAGALVGLGSGAVVGALGGAAAMGAASRNTWGAFGGALIGTVVGGAAGVGLGAWLAASHTSPDLALGMAVVGGLTFGAASKFINA